MKNLSPIDDDKDVVTKEYVDTAKSQAAINRTTLGTQCKNLLKNNAVTKTVSGVTFTINDDKSITVNGTATAQISFMINDKVGLGIGNYILTGCPSGGSWDTFYLTAYASSAWLTAPDFGSGCKIENKTVTQVVISIASGYTANNLTFKPMLRYADITDSTYEPYKESVDERLIQNKSDIAVNKSTIGYQRKNLLPFPKSISKGGITFTYDENGYMTASNTTSDARQWTAYNSQYNVKLKPGKYILSFVSASVCTNAYGNIMVLKANDEKIVDIGQTNYYNKTSGAIEFTIDTEQTVYIMSKIFDGKTAIMIRDADIIDDTYEPYQPSLQEQITALEERIAALGG